MFESKAKTLAMLAGRVLGAEILPSQSFTAADWLRRRESIRDEVLARDDLTDIVIVRSSARDEDAACGSAAGKYLSKACARVGRELVGAIDDVVRSYGRISDSDEVLVQPFLRDTCASGVAFNREPRTGAFYDVVNLARGGDTSVVTSGAPGLLEVYAASRWAPCAHPAPLGGVIALLRELETVVGDVPLDIEFAVRGCGGLVLLQARPLPCAPPPTLAPMLQRRLLEEVEQALGRLLAPHGGLLGRRGILGVMPDWNPAEMIGLRPRPLALSLYRMLITDSVWARQRRRYGYRDTRDVPLMLDLYGLPYVDVTASFNSFVPARLPEDVASRLVDACLDRLAENPHLHDKIEFEIVPSCYTFDLPRKLERLAGLSGSDREAITGALQDLTRGFLAGSAGRRIERDERAIALLEQRQLARPAGACEPAFELHHVLAECRRYGTAPFAGLARAAFVATDMLCSAVAAGVLDAQSAEAFLAALRTPASGLVEDLRRLDRAAFLAIYGHLRPGTYDIRVSSYAEEPDRYLPAVDGPDAPARQALAEPEMDGDSTARLSAALDAHGLPVTAAGFMNFVARSVVARERAKFVFSRSVSRALGLVTSLGEEHGFSREDLSFADIRDILELRISCCEPRDTLARSIAVGRARYEKANAIALPPLLLGPGDVWAFHVPSARPNFVTRRVVEGPVRTPCAPDLAGAIVFVPNADPGFDWLFGKRIGGLVTAYGGSNSHMAIRAAEIGLPAVIGAGETLFGLWSGARRLRIDCGVERVEVVS